MSIHAEQRAESFTSVFFPVRCMHHKCIIQKIVHFTCCPQANPGFSPVIGKTSNCWLLHSMLTRLWNQCSPFYHTPPFSNNTQLMAQHTTSVVVNAWTARQSTFARTPHGIAKYPAWLCHNGNTGPSPPHIQHETFNHHPLIYHCVSKRCYLFTHCLFRNKDQRTI